MTALSEMGGMMKQSTKMLAGLGAVGVAALMCHPAFAQAVAAAPAPAATPVIATPSLANMNKGDNTWMLVSTLLVLMMSVPGLALFYGGLVRTKNMKRRPRDPCARCGRQCPPVRGA